MLFTSAHINSRFSSRIARALIRHFSTLGTENLDVDKNPKAVSSVSYKLFHGKPGSAILNLECRNSKSDWLSISMFKFKFKNLLHAVHCAACFSHLLI